MRENRLPKRLTKYWERIKNHDAFPPISAFDPQKVADLWPNCFRISRVIEGNQPFYLYDFVGKKLESVFGVNLSGRKVKAKIGFLPAQQLLDQVEKAVLNPVPITIDGEYIDADGKLLKYRACLLPFGTNRNNVTHLIIGVSWKIY